LSVITITTPDGFARSRSRSTKVLNIRNVFDDSEHDYRVELLINLHSKEIALVEPDAIAVLIRR
jgi:hypothetical protein